MRERERDFSFLQAARDYGYTLLSRTPHQCSLATPEGEVVDYDILHTLHFDSNRKCMSIVVRQKGSSRVILYSKGADSTIYRNMRGHPMEGSVFHESGIEDPDTVSLPSQQSNGTVGERAGRARACSLQDTDELSRSLMGVALLRDQTQTHLDDYAKLGLRTLCMAKRVSCEATIREVSWGYYSK